MRFENSCILMPLHSWEMSFSKVKDRGEITLSYKSVKGKFKTWSDVSQSTFVCSMVESEVIIPTRGSWVWRNLEESRKSLLDIICIWTCGSPCVTTYQTGQSVLAAAPSPQRDSVCLSHTAAVLKYHGIIFLGWALIFIISPTARPSKILFHQIQALINY